MSDNPAEAERNPQQAILAALNRCIIGVGKVKKGSKNPLFDSTYAKLEDILDTINPFVHQEGLAISQSPGYDGATQCATMILSFIDPQGNALNYCTSQLPVGKLYKKNGEVQEPNAQLATATMTYLARTQLAHVFRLNLTDNDGNDAGRDERDDRSTAPPARAATGTPQVIEPPARRPAPSAAKAREGKGWDEPEFGKFTLKNREWVLSEMNVRQLGTVAFSADDRGASQYPPQIIKLCETELLRRVAAGDLEATQMIEANAPQ